MTRVPRAHALAALTCVLAAAGCSPSVNTLQVTVDAYISSVSLNDVARILDLSAPYQRALKEAPAEQAEAIAKDFRGRIEEGYMRWEGGRGTGQLELDPLGIALIRGIGLGKEGAAAIPLGVRFEADDMRGVVVTRAISNYRSIRWETIPAGGRIYLMGYPFGKIINFATGYDDPSGFELLDTVDLEWTLVRIPGLRTAGAPSDWFVESAEPVEGTATKWRPPGPQAP